MPPAAAEHKKQGGNQMALMTGEQYIESIRSLNLQVYMFGK